MRITRVDPMTGNEVADPDSAPYVIEGKGPGAVKICFESVVSKQDYIEFVAESTEPGLIEIYNLVGDDEAVGTIN